MEAIENAAEERLVDSLSFKLPGTGQYITDRRFTTWHTTGSNVYSPEIGTRVLKFRLGSEGWLDPQTFRIMFNVVNKGAAGEYLYPCPGAWGFFKRLRILCRGQLIEDIDYYNRCHEMFSLLQTKEQREQEIQESTGGNPLYLSEMDYKYTTNSVGVSSYSTYMFKPMCGLFTQKKYIPLRYCPIEIELELADTNEPINFLPLITDTTANIDWTTNVSSLWELFNCVCKCDVCTIDNEMDNEFASVLLSGKSLTITFNSMISQVQTLVSNEIQVNVSRSLARLDGVFASLIRDMPVAADKTAANANWTGRYKANRKSWNEFYTPLYALNTEIKVIEAPRINPNNDITKFQIQIGSKLYPEYPIGSTAEAYYYLRKYFNNKEMAITGKNYRDKHFIMGINTEKLTNVSFTGMNTKSSNVTIHLNMKQHDMADRIHIVLVNTAILEINDQSVSVYDEENYVFLIMTSID